MPRRLSVHLIALVLLATAMSGLATAAEHRARLIMFEDAACDWCEAWNDEVGIIYAKTDTGALAPLRRVDIDAPRPSDLASIAPVVFTPTFVLTVDNTEVGRITGYPGEAFFWGLLDTMVERKLPCHIGTKKQAKLESRAC